METEMEGDTICNSCGSHPEEKAEEKQEERRLSEERSPLDKATKEIDSKTTDLPMPMPMDTADTKALAVIKTEKEDSFSEKETIISVDENCNTNSEREIIIRSGAKNENDADDSLQREQQAAKTVKEADDRLSLNQRECEDGEKKGEENKDSDLPKAHINNRGQPEAIDIGQAPPPPPLHITNFFIDNILKPDFGRGKVIQKSNALHRVSIENRHCHHHHSDSDSNSICSVDTSSLRSPRNLTSSRTVNDDDDDEGVISPGVHDNRRVSSHYSIHGDSEGVDCDRRSPASQSQPIVWPAWVYCTRYSDRPSSGPRSRKLRRKDRKSEEKRPRTAFTNEQLKRLKDEFENNRYLTEERRQNLATELGLNESQIKIWFQNKRAKMKKSSGVRNSLAMQLMAQGLYNHATTSAAAAAAAAAAAGAMDSD